MLMVTVTVLFTVVLFYIQQVVLFSTFPILLLSYYINGYRLRKHIITENSVNNLLRVPFSTLSFIEKKTVIETKIRQDRF
jgi:hypothetical protein